jgi:stress response protein YsnF
MSDIDTSPVSDLTGRTVIDPDGDKIGTVFDVYVDNETDQPEWLAITTGLFGTKVSFAPIAGAAFAGDDLQLGYTKDLVKDAPKAEADGQLSPDEEAALYAHYGRTTNVSDSSAKGRTIGGDRRHDTSGAETDDAMTRSEEELDVSTRAQVTGKARLRKWVETEDVHMVVPVRREKARLVTEPITDANRDAALSGDDITEEEHEVTLSEEVVDVAKHVEPKERVRLETEVETREVPVDEEVRKERIEMDHDANPNR